MNNKPLANKIAFFSILSLFMFLLEPLYAEEKLTPRGEKKLTLRGEKKLTPRGEKKLTPRGEKKLTLRGEKKLTLRGKEVIILFEGPLRIAAEEVVKIYPALKRELEETLRWRVNFRPTVLLIKESKAFQRMARNNLIVAFAIPQRNLVVIDYSKMRTHPFSIETTLKHELCHLLLHNHIRKENLPRWLDEGIAQWTSDGIAEIIMNQKRSVLDEATLKGKYISIRALTNRFPGEKRSLMLAYEESKSLVEYMISSFGSNRILKVLNYLRDGSEVDVAILKGLSISLDELEERWHHHLKKRITWLTYLINHLYQILFFLAALVMIWGFIIRLMRKRAYRDEEEESGITYQSEKD